MKGLGQRIRDMRKERKLTLVQMAGKTGIDQATLCRIEKGRMTGTVQSHMRIATALEITLPELYEGVLQKNSEEKDRKVREKISTFFHSEGSAVAELLTTGMLQKKMMPIRLRLKRDSRTTAEEYPPGTERFVYVLAGAAEIHFDGQHAAIKTGESLYFVASKRHFFANPSKADTVLLSVMTPSSL